MYVCIYIYIYIYISIHLSLYLSLSIYIYIYIYWRLGALHTLGPWIRKEPVRFDSFRFRTFIGSVRTIIFPDTVRPAFFRTYRGSVRFGSVRFRARFWPVPKLNGSFRFEVRPVRFGFSFLPDELQVRHSAWQHPPRHATRRRLEAHPEGPPSKSKRQGTASYSNNTSVCDKTTLLLHEPLPCSPAAEIRSPAPDLVRWKLAFSHVFSSGGNFEM